MLFLQLFVEVRWRNLDFGLLELRVYCILDFCNVDSVYFEDTRVHGSLHFNFLLFVRLRVFLVVVFVLIYLLFRLQRFVLYYGLFFGLSEDEFFCNMLWRLFVHLWLGLFFVVILNILRFLLFLFFLLLHSTLIQLFHCRSLWLQKVLLALFLNNRFVVICVLLSECLPIMVHHASFAKLKLLHSRPSQRLLLIKRIVWPVIAVPGTVWNYLGMRFKRNFFRTFFWSLRAVFLRWHHSFSLALLRALQWVWHQKLLVSKRCSLGRNFLIDYRLGSYVRILGVNLSFFFFGIPSRQNGLHHWHFSCKQRSLMFVFGNFDKMVLNFRVFVGHSDLHVSKYDRCILRVKTFYHFLQVCFH